MQEKTAFLLLYAVSVSAAIAIFLYCTRIVGLTVDDLPAVAVVTIMIPASIAVIGSLAILMLAGKENKKLI